MLCAGQRDVTSSAGEVRAPSLHMGPGKCSYGGCDCKEWKRKVADANRCDNCDHSYCDHGF
jgi:hypothetical protein